MNRRILFIGVFLTCAACLGRQDLIAQSTGFKGSWRGLQLFNANSTPHPAVVRVFAAERDAMSAGSGTLVATSQQHGLVLTNWHVVRDASGEISVVFPDGFRSPATVLKLDSDWDLAALLIWRPYATPIPIASTPPSPGDVLTIAGYGQGKYRSATARCTQYVSPGANFPYEMVEVSAQAREGDSGGPILNNRGELAGVLFGSGRGTTSGSQSSRVRSFLADVWPPAHNDHAHAHVASAPSDSGEPDLRLGEPQFSSREGEPLVRSTQPTEREVEPPERVVRRLAPTDTANTDSWQKADKPVAEPEFVRTSSDEADAVFTPIERVSESDSPAVSPRMVDWDGMIGQTPLEKAKTTLAAIGLLAVAIQLAKWTGGNADRNEAERGQK